MWNDKIVSIDLDMEYLETGYKDHFEMYPYPENKLLILEVVIKDSAAPPRHALLVEYDDGKFKLLTEGY